jgi:predicted nucleic acid-binding protein
VIILDTDVISELTRPVPDPDVVSWLDSLPTEDTAITAITAAELLYGVRRLPDGRRKVELAEAIHALINADFRDRVEPFDLQHEAPPAHREPGGCFVIEVEVPQLAEDAVTRPY